MGFESQLLEWRSEGTCLGNLKKVKDITWTWSKDVHMNKVVADWFLNFKEAYFCKYKVLQVENFYVS